MKNNFVSKHHPLMNPFLLRLQKALENLPNNPKPSCEGFYLADWDSKEEVLIVEKFGDVPHEKDYKYLHFAAKKATQVLYLKKYRSLEFANDSLEQYPGGVIIGSGLNSSGTSGHESMVDEAISFLWSIARRLIKRYDGLESLDVICKSRPFFYQILSDAEIIHEELAPDNQWIVKIASMMTEDN